MGRIGRAIPRLYVAPFHVSTLRHSTSPRRTIPRLYVVPFHVSTSCHSTSIRRAVTSQEETLKAGLGDAPSAVLLHDDSVVFINQLPELDSERRNWVQDLTQNGGIG